MSSKSIDRQAAKTLIDRLNYSLAQTLDLKLQAKQAHWNVTGVAFIAWHELFDKVADEIDEYADMQAERIVQLDGTARGTLQSVAAASTLPPYSLELHNGQDHVEALAAAISTVADTARELIDTADELGDKVTADLCTEVARGLDKLRWLVAAHS